MSLETNATLAHDLDACWRSSDVLLAENVDFNKLLLSENVLQGLKNSGFIRPSPVQLKAIPLGKCGFDLIVQSKSGTGKTCVFAVLALESINVSLKSVQVLIVAPTREIAVQICDSIKDIGSCIPGLRVYNFIGGFNIAEDKKRLHKCHIAVGTPGRLKHLIGEGFLKVETVRLFVLDEADRLLEESFQTAIKWISSVLPMNRQTLALSATYTEELKAVMSEFMRNPVFVNPSSEKVTLLGLVQYYLLVPFSQIQSISFKRKLEALLPILRSMYFLQCLIFVNSQGRAFNLCESLKSSGWPVNLLSGGQEQKERLQSLSNLKHYKCRILVSTDLSARGIDAEKVNLVINFDVPYNTETYLHRIGRAGRYGTYGLSFTIVGTIKEAEQLLSMKKESSLDLFSCPEPFPPDIWSYEPENENCLKLEQVIAEERGAQNIVPSESGECERNGENIKKELVSNLSETNSVIKKDSDIPKTEFRNNQANQSEHLCDKNNFVKKPLRSEQVSSVEKQDLQGQCSSEELLSELHLEETSAQPLLVPACNEVEEENSVKQTTVNSGNTDTIPKVDTSSESETNCTSAESHKQEEGSKDFDVFSYFQNIYLSGSENYVSYEEAEASRAEFVGTSDQKLDSGDKLDSTHFNFDALTPSILKNFSEEYEQEKRDFIAMFTSKKKFRADTEAKDNSEVSKDGSGNHKESTEMKAATIISKMDSEELQHHSFEDFRYQRKSPVSNEEDDKELSHMNNEISQYKELESDKVESEAEGKELHSYEDNSSGNSENYSDENDISGDDEETDEDDEESEDEEEESEYDEKEEKSSDDEDEECSDETDEYSEEEDEYFDNEDEISNDYASKSSAYDSKDSRISQCSSYVRSSRRSHSREYRTSCSCHCNHCHTPLPQSQPHNSYSCYISSAGYIPNAHSPMYNNQIPFCLQYSYHPSFVCSYPKCALMWSRHVFDVYRLHVKQMLNQKNLLF